MKKITSNTYLIPFIYLMITLLLLIIRLYQLHADPPSQFDIQFISDEGWWVHNARNKALFGSWIIDEFNQSLLVSPTFCFLVFIAFKLFGVGFFSARLVSAISGTLAVLLLALFTAKHLSRTAGIVTLLLAGLNYPFLFLNRIAFVDSLMLLFVCGALYLGVGVGTKLHFRFLAGMLLGAAVCTKSFSAVMLPVWGILVLLEKQYGQSWKHIILGIISCSVGLSVVFGIWVGTVYLPHQRDFELMYSLWSDGNLPHSAVHVIKNIFQFFFFVSEGTITFRHFLQQNVLLMFTLLLLIWNVLGRVGSTEQREQMSYFEAANWFWLIIAVCMILPLTAKPLRRYIFILPPLILLITQFITDRNTKPPPSTTRREYPFINLIRILLFSGFMTLLIVPYFTIPLRNLISNLKLPPGKFVFLQTHVDFVAMGVSVLTFVFCLFVAYPIVKRIPKFLSINKRFLLSVLLVFELSRLGLYFTSLTFTQYETSKYLGQKFTSQTKVLGGVADSLCLENNAFTFAIWGRQEASRVLNERPVARFKPDYLLIAKKFDVFWPPEERYMKYVRPENFLETIRLFPAKNDFRVVIDVYSLKNISEE